MRAVPLVALWFAISVPVAMGLAASLRATRGAGIAEEVEFYLKGLATRDRARRRPVTVAVFCVAVTAIGLALSAPLDGVTDRVHTVASGTGERSGPGRGSSRPATPAPASPSAATATPAVTADGSAPVAPELDPRGAAQPRGVIVAPGILGGPSDTSRWRRDEQRAASAEAPREDADADDAADAGEREPASDRDDQEGAATDPAVRQDDDGAPADEPADAEQPRDLDGDGIPDEEDDDLDGDGVPNDDDDDLDGDDIPNDEDTDVDGDGIPNDDDAAVDEPAPHGSEGSADSQESRREEPSS